MTASTDTAAAKKDLAMARTDVKGSVKQAGTALGQSAKDLAGTVREHAAPVAEAATSAASSAVSSAVDTAAARGRRARKLAAKRAEQLQKQASKSASKTSKKARKRAKQKAHGWADLAAEKAGRKPKRSKGKVLALIGGCALAGYAIVTVRKKQAEQQGPRTPDTDPAL